MVHDCATDYLYCRGLLSDDSYWNLVQPEDVASYEAIRVAVRFLAGLIESGAATLDGTYLVSTAAPSTWQLDALTVAYDSASGRSTVLGVFNDRDVLGEVTGNWRTWTYMAGVAGCLSGQPEVCGPILAAGFGARSIGTVQSHGLSLGTLKTVGLDAMVTGLPLLLVGAPAYYGGAALATESGMEVAPALSTLAPYSIGSTVAVGDIVCAVRCATWVG